MCLFIFMNRKAQDHKGFIPNPPSNDIQIQCDCNGKPWRDFVEPELITRFLWRQEPRITKTSLKSTQWGLVQHQGL